jgi:hypothetical protein
VKRKKIVAVSALVIFAAILMIAAPSIATLPAYTDRCMLIASDSSRVPLPSGCSVSLSAASASPGTKITATFVDPSFGLHSFQAMPYDPSFGYDPFQIMPYSGLFDQSSPKYSIHLEGQGTVLEITSGSFTCSSVPCSPNDPLVTVINSGTFSTTFAMPNVASGTYNVVVTLEYPTLASSQSTGASSYLGESAIAPITVV